MDMRKSVIAERGSVSNLEAKVRRKVEKEVLCLIIHGMITMLFLELIDFILLVNSLYAAA